MRLAGLLILAPLALAALGCRRGPLDLTGEWVGGFRFDGDWSALRVHLKSDGAIARGTIDLPFEFAAGLPVEVAGDGADHLTFAVAAGAARLDFDGRLDRGALDGEVRRSGARGTFRLVRLAPIDRSRLLPLAGDYADAAGRITHVQIWDELGPDQLACFDEDGGVRALYPGAEDAFFAGETIATPAPADRWLSFVRGRDGRATRLEWRGPGGEGAAARTDDVVQEEVAFPSAGLTLAGSLLLPRAAGRHAAMVVVHGSGPQDRQAVLPFVWFLARRGIALLVYDKRGAGASEGDWRRASFEDLAADARAAIAYLKGRPEIDPRRIGLFGASQGGWVVPLAAAGPGGAAFLVSVSGPGVSPAEETIDFTGNEMRALGFPEEEIAQAVALTRLGQEFARTGRGYDRVEAAARAARERPWFFPEMAPPREHWMWGLWSRIVDYDPEPALSRVSCPVLALFGGLDRNVLAAKNGARWSGALRRGGNRDVSVVTLPRGNHLLLEAVNGTSAEVPRLRRFLPEYRSTVIDWMGRRGLFASD